MLFDSSIWVDFSRGTSSAKVDLLQQEIHHDRTVAICPPIYQEVLQGIRNDSQYNELKELLISLDFLYLDGYQAAEGSAEIYRTLRKKGITVEKPNDCLIAFYAIHFKLVLVHNDSDFDQIAKHSSLKIYKA
jgi:predicted nucleic acid-binding protein